MCVDVREAEADSIGAQRAGGATADTAAPTAIRGGDSSDAFLHSKVGAEQVRLADVDIAFMVAEQTAFWCSQSPTFNTQIQRWANECLPVCECNRRTERGSKRSSSLLNRQTQ